MQNKRAAFKTKWESFYVTTAIGLPYFAVQAKQNPGVNVSYNKVTQSSSSQKAPANHTPTAAHTTGAHMERIYCKSGKHYVSKTLTIINKSQCNTCMLKHVAILENNTITQLQATKQTTHNRNHPPPNGNQANNWQSTTCRQYSTNTKNSTLQHTLSQPNTST